MTPSQCHPLEHPVTEQAGPAPLGTERKKSDNHEWDPKKETKHEQYLFWNPYIGLYSYLFRVPFCLSDAVHLY